MEKEIISNMSDELCVGIMTLAGTLITFIVSAIIQSFRDRRSYKQERVMKIIEYKVLAYQETYSALMRYKDYFMLFVDAGNEFKVSWDAEQFAPLEENMKLREVYNKNILCFSNKLQQKIETTLQSGETLNNLGIVLSTDKPEDIFGDSVPPSCEHVIKQVDECIKQIKKELIMN